VTFRALRLGHTIPGTRGVYTHVSDTMRADLKQALQARLEASLRGRAQSMPPYLKQGICWRA
jgi:hypothetical protein